MQAAVTEFAVFVYYSEYDIAVNLVVFNPFNASCSNLLLFEGFGTILV